MSSHATFTRIFALLVIGFCIRAVVAGGPSPLSNEQREAPVGSADEARQRADGAARAKLASVLTDLKLDEESLSDAIDALRDRSGASIFVNWKTLEAAGVSRNTAVSIHLKGKRLSTWLDVLLAIAGADRDERLAYSVEDGVITVSTADDLAKNVMVRVYDIRDLLAGAGNARQKRVDAIIKLLIHQVDPASWRSADQKPMAGKVGAIRELQGQLIVTQTPANHRRLVSLVEDLRALRPAQYPADFPLLERNK